MSTEIIPQNVAPVIAAEFKRLASMIQNADPKWRGNDCIDTRGGKIDPQERAAELIIQAVHCGLLRQVPKMDQLVEWAEGRDLHPLEWPFAEGHPRASSYAFPYKRCPRNVFNTVVGERQQIMTVFPPEVERENEYHEHHPGRREATRENQSAMTADERELREQARHASERECKKPVVWPLPPHGLLSEVLPSMFPAGDHKSWSDTDEAVVALHERNDRYARACLALATLIEQEQWPNPSAHNESGNEYLSHLHLAEKYGVNAEATRKALGRWRKKNAGGDGYVQNSDRRPNEPEFLYSAKAVALVMDGLKARTAKREIRRTKLSGQRPAR